MYNLSDKTTLDTGGYSVVKLSEEEINGQYAAPVEQIVRLLLLLLDNQNEPFDDKFV